MSQEYIQKRILELERKEKVLTGMIAGAQSSLLKTREELTNLRVIFNPKSGVQNATPAPAPVGSWEEVQRMTRPENNPHPPGRIQSKPPLPQDQRGWQPQ